MTTQIVIGKVVGTFGLKGFLKIWPLTDFPERFNEGQTIFINVEPYKVREVQWHKKQARVRLHEVLNISAAEALIGAEITIPPDIPPQLEEGEFLIGDVVGLEVFDESGKRLGSVEEVIPAPAQDLYRVGDTLIPAVAEFVKEVDLNNRKMIVRPIPGMFDDEI
jgi:16S rRNA processing protein RimM